jgi:hypothetical protein
MIKEKESPMDQRLQKAFDDLQDVCNMIQQNEYKHKQENAEILLKLKQCNYELARLIEAQNETKKN